MAVYHFAYEDPGHLPEAAMIGLGVFVRLNVAAERLEPEAMEEAKQEDETVNEMKP